MLFTDLELSLISNILQFTQGQPRVYAFSDRKKAESIFDKIIVSTKDVENGTKEFIEGDIEVSTEEKALIITLIPSELSIADGKVADSLLEKIK